MVAAAVKAVQDAKDAAESAANGVNVTADNAIASIKAATQVAGVYRDEAQAKATEAATQAKQAGDSAAIAYSYIADTLANKNASAASALQAAEEAAKAQLSANAAAGAAGEAATTAAQQSITLHNARIDAHNGVLLPVAGGTMTGNITVAGDSWQAISSNNKVYLRIYGPNGTYPNAMYLGADSSYLLIDSSSSSVPGRIQLFASDGKNSSYFRFHPDGTLTINGNKTFLGTTVYPNSVLSRDSAYAYIVIRGGDVDNAGGSLYLYGTSWSNFPGGFFLRTSSGIGMRGLPNGSLVWNSRDITMGFPNYSAGIIVTSPTAASQFTAPDDGFYIVPIAPTTVGASYAYINEVKTNFWGGNDGDYGANRSASTIPLKKGDTLYFYPDCGNNGIFYPVR